MSKKKSPNSVAARGTPPKAAAPAPVAHGDCFRTFIDEARSIGNECVSRRQFDEDVVEFLKEKGMFADWAAWRTAKRGPS